MRGAWIWAMGLGCWAGLAAGLENPPDPDPKDVFQQMFSAAASGAGRQRPALCPICGKPFYKHVADPKDPAFDPNFQCVPVGRQVAQIERLQVKCPVCEARVWVAKPGHQNARAGMDSDLCWHSEGKVAVHSAVWMCPECGYAALLDWFATGPDGRAVTDEIRRLVQETIAPLTRQRMMELVGLNVKTEKPLQKEYFQFAGYLDETAVPDWMKYEHALMLVEKAGLELPSDRKAKLYLGAAHSCRRALASELTIHGLDPILQMRLSRAFLRVDRALQEEVRSLRREKELENKNPLDQETDALWLSAAASSLDQRWTQGGAGARAGDAEVLVLQLRRAGFLDRLGKTADAEKVMGLARKVVTPPPATADQQQQAHLERQFRLLDAQVEQRLGLLGRERSWMMKAAVEVARTLSVSPYPEKLEPIQHAYLVGELLRRSGQELPTAVRWLEAAQRLFKVKALAERVPVNAREHLQTLIEEQLREAREKAGSSAPIPGAVEAIERFCKRVCETFAPGVSPPPTAVSTAPATAPPVSTAPAAPVKLSRRELLGRYHRALSKYHQDKQANAPRLSELVKEGYLKAEEANLDPTGRLLCPETGKPIHYSRSAVLGDPRMTILFPEVGDTNRLRLLGDGSIDESKKSE